ncbi:hypothetical protein AMAG_08083 [Allomyces macrogynus ATCC 38327]|uniref:EamA domain-containing protein n=1 Tax=Allomyces macrogynus (strain ATCC 38327) TaxID=578462 RepID=A0A0L0SKH9_ALLM3|nr:hypothetical protein AMAG_08083 [Allomyces macrogynus ATCC 38327]|eukprot:KNE62905.1 hypothetical protein AMAG_08083 [Allomyces macrogynus ATCC 38327]
MPAPHASAPNSGDGASTSSSNTAAAYFTSSKGGDHERAPLLSYPAAERDLYHAIPTTGSGAAISARRPSATPPLTAHVTSELAGLICMALSALFFSVMSALVKHAGFTFPTFEVVFARSVIQWTLGVIGCWWVGVPSLGPKEVRTLLVMRGSAGAIGLGAYFYAIIHMDLGESTVIFFTGPAFTALLAHLVLGEPLTRLDILSIVACLTGVTLVARPAALFPQPIDDPASVMAMAGAPTVLEPAPAWQRPAAIFAALLGAVMSSCAYVLVRKVGRGAHYLIHVVYFGMASTALSGVLMVIAPDERGPARWPATLLEATVLLAIGVTAFGGQVLLNKGLQLARAGPGVLMRNLDVVFAFIFGITLFDERPFVTSILGAILIVGTTVLTGIGKLIAHRREQARVAVEAEDAEARRALLAAAESDE